MLHATSLSLACVEERHRQNTSLSGLHQRHELVRRDFAELATSLKRSPASLACGQPIGVGSVYALWSNEEMGLPG
jgi:hypothetical protein